MKKMNDPLPGRKVFILEWRPAISSYKMEDFTDELEHFDNAWFNWSIWDWQKALPGDELRQGLTREKTGPVKDARSTMRIWSLTL